MKWVKRKNVEADMEDVGLFFGKNKGRACFFVARDHKRMYTKIECVSMRDLKKEHKKRDKV